MAKHEHTLTCLENVGGELVCKEEKKPRKKGGHKGAYSADEEAIAGYEAAPGTKNPFLGSSPSYYAWNLGAHFKATGRTEPRDVRMGRGYTIWGNDMLFNAETMERLK